MATDRLDPSAAALPVNDIVGPLRQALREARRAIVVAPPGAGKTTLIPLKLVDEPWLAGQRIVMLEPRRLATRAAARRMADLIGDEVGHLVGYQTRDERHISHVTRIEVVTEGILTRRLQNDPELPGVGLVIFDEVHERNLPTDLGLALALDVVDTVRPDLRLLAMSATPDVSGLQRIFGDVPVLTSDGRMFPVDVRWAPRKPAKPGVRRGNPAAQIEHAVADTVQHALRDGPGDVLVFLPGIAEIMRTKSLLETSLAGNPIDVYPLAGALSLAEQDLALAPSPPGRRRVVLATDIAETSLTVDGVRIVVDTGLARAPRFDAGTGMSRLTTVTTSRSSADQRAGRAGRVEPGTAYRLWSKIEHGSRLAHRVAEIDEADLAGLALELAAWGTPVADLAFISPPPPRAMKAAHETLTALGALDADGRITAAGRAMLGLPVHPRLARMLTESPTTLACVVAALVDERDILRGRPDELPSDLAMRVGIVAGSGHHPLADRGSVRRVQDRSRDLARRLRISFDLGSVESDDTGTVLLHAFPDRVAAQRRPGQFQLRTGTHAWVPETDPLANEAFIVAADLDGKRDRARIGLGAALGADAVAAEFSDELAETVSLEWDPARDDLVERVERRLGSMRLGETVRRPGPSDATLAALLDRARVTGLASLGWSSTSMSLRQRVEYLHRSVGEPWPDWSVSSLSATLADWLGPYLPGATGRADLENIDVTMVLRSQLPWPQGSELDVLAPAELALPTGRTAPIDYSGDQPAASVRVQDLFGTTVHPTAGGQPIVLHLLSPADRPIQVTADLPGFWTGSWAEVRKELAGRYPKHQWPADPAHAEPKRLKDR